MPIIIDDKEITEIWLPDSEGKSREIVKVMYTLNKNDDRIVFEKKSDEPVEQHITYKFNMIMDNLNLWYGSSEVPCIIINNKNLELTLDGSDYHTLNDKTFTIKYTPTKPDDGLYGIQISNIPVLTQLSFTTENNKDNYAIWLYVNSCNKLKTVTFDSHINDIRCGNAENFHDCPEFKSTGEGSFIVDNKSLYDKLTGDSHTDNANLFSDFDRTKIIYNAS